MPDTSVVYFDSTMTGAPAISGEAGKLFPILDACLVNGFGVGTLDSIAVVDNVATCTLSAGHGLAMQGTTGPVIRISGIVGDDAVLNGDFRVASVPTSTTFTFATTDISDTSVNNVVCKRKPAGFEKAFSGTNLAAYRSMNIQGTQLYLRVDDTGTTFARIRGYESMSGIDSDLVGPFPTDAQVSGGLYARKSSVASTATRSWRLFADDRLVYLFVDAGADNYWLGGFVFGDIHPFLSSDAYSCLIIGHGSTSTPDYYMDRVDGTVNGSYLARAYTQIGTSVTSSRYSHRKTTSSVGLAGEPYPASVDNSINIWPVEVWESNTLSRGMLPGFWNPIHASNPNDAALITDITQLPGRTLFTQRLNNTPRCLIDITGPWR